jgi:hypothetical protein
VPSNPKEHILSPRILPVALASAAAAAAALLVPTAAADPTETSTADYPSDEYGYTDSAARCDAAQTVMEFGRTSRALVAICVNPDGQLEYRGVRLSDQAALTMPASRGADGAITASNDGVTYAVTPELLLVSEGDSVLYRDGWIEFQEPRFSAGESSSSATSSATPTPTETTATSPTTSPTTTPTTPTTSAAPATTTPTADSSPPTASSSPTVSTTTVTLTPG